MEQLQKQYTCTCFKLEVPIGSNYNNSMMNEKFKEELNLPATTIPMKDYCMRKALKHVKEEAGHFCDPKYLNMLAIAKLEEAWEKVTARVPDIRPNHRWNCIEGELNSQWVDKNWDLA